MVRQSFRNAWVVGSNPISGSISKLAVLEKSGAAFLFYYSHYYDHLKKEENSKEKHIRLSR